MVCLSGCASKDTNTVSVSFSTPESSDAQISEFPLNENAPILEKRFGLWMNAWHKVLPQLHIQDFVYEKGRHFWTQPGYALSSETLASMKKKPANDLSPDGTKTLSYTPEGCLPEQQPCLGDSGILSVDDLSEKTGRQIEVGDSLFWDDATWLTKAIFAVVTHPAACKKYDENCRVPYLYVYDIQKNVMWSYRGPEVQVADYQKTDFPSLRYLRAVTNRDK